MEKIALFQAKNKRGGTILKKNYDQVYELIISKISSSNEGEVA